MVTRVSSGTKRSSSRVSTTSNPPLRRSSSRSSSAKVRTRSASITPSASAPGSMPPWPGSKHHHQRAPLRSGECARRANSRPALHRQRRPKAARLRWRQSLSASVSVRAMDRVAAPAPAVCMPAACDLHRFGQLQHHAGPARAPQPVADRQRTCGPIPRPWPAPSAPVKSSSEKSSTSRGGPSRVKTRQGTGWVRDSSKHRAPAACLAEPGRLGQAGQRGQFRAGAMRDGAADPGQTEQYQPQPEAPHALSPPWRRAVRPRSASCPPAAHNRAASDPPSRRSACRKSACAGPACGCCE